MAGFDDYDTGGFYDEMFLPDGVPRPEAALLARLIGSLPDGEMNRRQQAAERALLHMGITLSRAPILAEGRFVGRHLDQ